MVYTGFVLLAHNKSTVDVLFSILQGIKARIQIVPEAIQI